MSRLILAALALVSLCTACSNEPALRDFYWGKSFLEPGRVPHPVPRDKYGNAVIEDRGKRDADKAPAADAGSSE